MARVEPDYELKVNNVSIKSDKVVKKISVNLPINNKASSFTAIIYNENGDWNNYFDYNDDIKISLGYATETLKELFHGTVEKIKRNWTTSGSTIIISGRGTWSKLMREFCVESYENEDLGDILKDLVSNYSSGITTTNVASAGISPDVEQVDHRFINDVIADYCIRAQYYAWVDFNDDLHFTSSPGTNSQSLTTANIKRISMNIDWKTIRNYIRTYGATIEEVQLMKTEEDTTSQTAYGMIQAIVKDGKLDTEDLVQSISDAKLLEKKDAEETSIAVIYGDERIEPAKNITVTVPALDVNGTYRVTFVKHVFEPASTGFTTTVNLVEDEVNTADYYKELYEKTDSLTDFANSGNYEESYAFTFSSAQDDRWTFTNTSTLDSYLRMQSLTSLGTTQLTNAYVGDTNYTKVLPMVIEDYSLNNANKYYASNDDGSTWEEIEPFGGTNEVPLEHTFVNSTGDKNDLKFKIEMGEFDALIHGSRINHIIVYRPDNYIEPWYGTAYKEWWRYGTGEGVSAKGVAFYYNKHRMYTSEGSLFGTDGKIFSMDAVTGKAVKEEAVLSINIKGIAHDGTNLYVMDATNNRISKRNADDLNIEDSFEAIPAGAGTEPWGLGYDGTNLIFTVRPDGVQYCSNAVWAKCTATQRFPEKGYYGSAGTYAHTGAGYNSVNSKFYAIKIDTKYLMEFNTNMISIDAAINMETVCGAAGYKPQSACDDNTTLWSTNTDGTTNRICKHNAGDYTLVAVATYDFSEATYGKFVGICFDGSDLWILSDLGTYGTWYRIDDSDGSLDATHTITGTESTGNLWADCEWDGSNLYATYTTAGTTNRDKVIYKFNATPTTISAELQIGHLPSKKTSYDGLKGRGLAWDGSNFWITWFFPDGVGDTHGSWFRLANSTEWGAITGAWYPFDCCSDGTYIWFLENTVYTTKISRATGEEIDSITTFEFAYGIEYAVKLTQSKIYTFGAYLKLVE